ncbi:hypothetical protein ABPG77_002516 [Micractinium sp. CCAP 211/92]
MAAFSCFPVASAAPTRAAGRSVGPVNLTHRTRAPSVRVMSAAEQRTSPQPGAAASTLDLPAYSEPVAALAAANPAYAAVLATQQAVLSLVTDALKLEAVCSSVTGPCGAFSAASADGSSGAAIGAARGGAVHCLSASALANRAAGFGTSRLLGFVEGDRDVPHFALEHVLAGDRLQGIITLWPRQNWVTDLEYTHKYFATGEPLHVMSSTAPAEGGPRSYNDVMNGVMGTAEKRAGWRHYTSPVAEVKPLLASSISYTFPAQQDDLDAFRAAALEVAQLWVSFLQAQPTPAKDAAQRTALDARYFSAITSDPANGIAVRMFGEDATDKLLKMATGHPAVST